MENFQTRIVLFGAVLSSVQSLLPQHTIVFDHEVVVINPDAPNSVELTSFNDDLVSALAHMSDSENGVVGEYYTKLGGDTTNFTAQKVYKLSKTLDQSNCFVRNDGKNGKAVETVTGELLYRKSTVAELIKRLGNQEIAGDTFTIAGSTCLLDAFVQVSGVQFDGTFDGNLTPSKTGLVSVFDTKAVHYALPEDWDKAMLATKAVKVAGLPTINGFEGTVEGDFVVYGCAKIPVVYFKPVDGATRRIKSLELTSEVIIDADAFEEIADFLK